MKAQNATNNYWLWKRSVNYSESASTETQIHSLTRDRADVENVGFIVTLLRGRNYRVLE